MPTRDPFAEQVYAPPVQKRTPSPQSGGRDPFAEQQVPVAQQAAQPPASRGFQGYIEDTKEAVGEIMDWQRGAGESIAALATGIPATVVAGLAGEGALLQGYSPEQASALIKGVQEDYSYKPDSPEAAKILSAISYPFEKWGEFTSYLADNVFEATKDAPLQDTGALLATAVKTAGEMAPVVVPTKAITAPVKVGTTISRTIGKTVEGVVSKKARERYIQQRAIDEIKADVADIAGLQKEAEKVSLIKEKIPGYSPTLAETTGSRALIAKQQQIDTQTPATLETAHARRIANKIAIQNFLDDSFGRQTPNIIKIFQDAKGQVDEALNKIDSELDSVRKKREALVADEPISQQVVGGALRKLADDEFQLTKAKGEALYNKIGDVPINTKPVYGKVNELMTTRFANYAEDQIPPVFKDIMGEYKALQGAVEKTPADPMTGRPAIIPEANYNQTLSKVRSLDKRLGRDIASEEASFRPDQTRIAALVEVRQALSKQMDSLELASDKAVVQTYKDAKQYWKEQVADRFYRGVGKRVRDSKYGEWNIADEKIIDEMFSPAKLKSGGVKAAQEFKAVYGENPEAMAQLNLGAMQKFRDFVVDKKTGVINPDRVEIFKDRYREVLGEYPRIQEQIKDLGSSNQALADLQKVILNKKAAMERDAFTKAVNTDTPYTLVSTAMKDPTIMRRLKGALKSEDAVNGLSKQVSDVLIRESSKRSPLDGNEYIDSSLMYSNLDKYKDSLAVGLTPKHLKALTDAYEALMRLDRVPLATKAAGGGSLGDTVTQAVGTSPRSLLNMMRARQQGRTSTVDIASVVSGGILNKIYKRRILELEKAAHYDMDAAVVLKQLATADKMTEGLYNKISSTLFRLGLGAEMAAKEPAETRGQKERRIAEEYNLYKYRGMKGLQ